MKFDIITIFPEIFDSFKNEALIARAQKKKIISINTHFLRDYTDDAHKSVDDRPYGGGPGMLLKVEPIFKAVSELKKKGGKSKVILFSPRGKKLDQKMVKKLSKAGRLILICGRYEGVDERVADHIADEVISIGDFVLSGGEVPAMVLTEAVSRMIPGVVGKEESAQKMDHAQYTRPEIFEAGSKKWKVPKVLLSGDHKKIEEWRKKHTK
ncbi:MAG: tRNA (guanosine(37)-N1)-methyltransferase TrmD [bacterium]|nr:tRNA (guanosine(37)-N1)-methyltransferase TrmD [bacterium]